MTVIVVLAVLSALLLMGLAVERARSRRGTWSDGAHRHAHAPRYLAGGAVIGDAGGGWDGFDGGGGGGGGDGGGGGC
jgi:uncharacterized membrane protein YgcG